MSTDSTAAPANNAPSNDPLAELIAKLEAEPITLAKFWKGPRNRRDQVTIRLGAYKGVPFADLRIFWTDKDGISRPGPKGVAVILPLLPELTSALLKLEDKARELGLLPEIGEGG